MRRGAATALACALLAAAAVAPPAAAQPWAPYAAPGPARDEAFRAGVTAWEGAWNALLVAELRASLARADSAARLFDLARELGPSETAALGTTIAQDALRLRTRWTRAQWRERVRAHVADSLGTAARRGRDFGRADSLYADALERFRALGERRGAAWMLGRLGANAFGAGDYAYADSLFRLALEARESLPDAPMTGASLNDLGAVAFVRGRHAEARGWFERAIAVRERTGETAALGSTLNFLGLALGELGERDSSAAAFDRALWLTSSQGDSARTLQVVINLGRSLARGSSPARALPVLDRALRLAAERGDRVGEGLARSHRGDALRRLGRFAESEREARAAAAAHEAAGNARGVVEALAFLGQGAIVLRDPGLGRPPLERAVAMAESLGLVAQAGASLADLAVLARMDGDPTLAHRFAARALERGAGAGDSAVVRGACVTLGELAVDTGDVPAARGWFARAAASGGARDLTARIADEHNLGLVETLEGRLDDAGRRFRAALDEAERAGLADEPWQTMLNLADVAERRGDPGAALAWTRRAAATVEALRERQGAEAQSIVVLARRRFAFDQMVHLLGKLDGQFPDSGFAAEAYHWAERGRARALLDLMGARAGDARPLTLAEARRVPAKGEALLEYSLGDSSTALWVVTRGGATFHRLPGRARLQARIEILRRGLASPERAGSRATLAAAYALWRELVAPALPEIRKAKRLIVSPDGPLALVPFEALLAAEPAGDAPPDAGDWLVARWAVSYTFSAGALAARRGPAMGHAVVAFADADFAGRLPRLPETARELEALRGHASKRTFVALEGAGATREALLGAGLERAALLHVATHGEANPTEPLRSGLWTSPAPGDSAPGFVSLADLEGLRLAAGLVTLSACETGLGRLERGEGVVGLTRGFLAAGARSVVVSLWKVNDRSTARLMERFYARLLGKRAARADALAAAKRALLAEPETRSPFHWAPFVLVGESGRME